MKIQKLCIVDYEKDFFETKYFSRIKALCNSIEFVNETDIKKRNALIKNSYALLVRYITPLDRTAIDSMPHLKYIGASSVAVDQIDVAYAQKKKIIIKNIAGYSSNSIGEFVFGALLTSVRHLPQALQNIKKNDFTVYPEYRGWELQGKTFGIVGLGNIGKRVGELALGFNMNVRYFSRKRKADCEIKGMKYLSIEKLLKISDVIGIFLELNNETNGMINKNYIKCIRSGSTVISTSHTEVFDFSTLIEALKKNQFTFIQAYFSTISDQHRDILAKIPNTILYPSIAIQTVETKARMQKMIVENLESFVKSL